ncbi:methyltransferase domain-containing protein [Halomonas salifodinae]|uniref:Methyltransferase domain-containing protein n=1 Tax=Halomonas salifodinae TaxID=438745 RepID=A0ABW2EV03_9GAMM
MNSLNVMPRHPLQPYWDIALASVQADALHEALELDLFRLLVDPGTVEEVAARFTLDVGNTGYLLELLWSMGLLERQADTTVPGRWHYCSAEVATHFFDSNAPRYCGDAWRFRRQSLRHFGGELGTLLRTGRGGGAPAATAWREAARRQIAQEQRAATVDAALAVVARLPEFPRARWLLDLGGGPGGVAIALAQANPGLRGVVLDLPEAAEVAQENLQREGMAGRLRARGGDLVSDAIGEQEYDLIWCSSVLHFVPDPAASLRKILAALRPGGVLICAQGEIPDGATEAREVLPYYLSLCMRGRRVTRQGELRRALAAAGFTGLESYPGVPFPMAPVTVLIGRRSPT